MVREKKIKLTPYRSVLSVVWYDTWEELESTKWKKVIPDKEEYNLIGGLTHVVEGDYVVFIRYKDINTLVHEVGHVVFDLMLSVGIPLANETHEPYTYLYAHIVEQIVIAENKFYA